MLCHVFNFFLLQEMKFKALGSPCPSCARDPSSAEERDVQEAGIFLLQHRDQRFVKLVVLKILQEYAQSHDNTLDDDMVEMIRSHINVNNERQ